MKPLPCPFCGSKAEITKNGYGTKFVDCSNIGCDAHNIGMLVEDWNTRSNPTTPAPDGLRMALEQFRRIEALLKSMMPNHGNPMHRGPGVFCPLCIATESIEALSAQSAKGETE